jgi:hypothetical protein
MQKLNYKFFTILIILQGCGVSSPEYTPVTKVSATAATCTCKSKTNPVKTPLSPKPVVSKDSNKPVVPVTSKTPEPTVSQSPAATTTKKSPLEQILERTKLIYSKINSTQVEMYTYAKGEYKDGKKTGNIRETFVKGKITTKNPGTIMINISDSDDPLAKGSSLLYPGSGKVKVKGGGFLGIIPVSFDLDDPKLSNSRNQRLTGLSEHITRLTAPGTDLKLLGTSTINGRKVYLIKSENPKLNDPEITYEIFGLDSQEFFLVSNEMYTSKNELVSQYQVKSFTINPKLADNFFSL